MVKSVYLSNKTNKFLSNYLYLQPDTKLPNIRKKEKNMENFVVSVARAILFEPSTNEVLAYATALSESAFTLAMQSQEIRGGIGNVLKFNYKNTRTLNISLTKVEHWFRRDKGGFAYPSVEDWNKIKFLLDDFSDEFFISRNWCC